MTVMKTQSAAWAAIAGGTWLGGTPGTDNGDFKDIPGVNKGRGLAGNDHIAGNNNANTILGDQGNDFLRGGGGGARGIGRRSRIALVACDEHERGEYRRHGPQAERGASDGPRARRSTHWGRVERNQHARNAAPGDSTPLVSS